MTEFTDAQRERLVQDIVNFEVNSAANSGDPLQNAAIEEVEQDTRALDDDALERIWRGTVGEWLCSIGGEAPAFMEAWETAPAEYDNPADWQFDVLLTDGDIAYSYTNEYVYETPYTNVDAP